MNKTKTDEKSIPMPDSITPTFGPGDDKTKIEIGDMVKFTQIAEVKDISQCGNVRVGWHDCENGTERETNIETPSITEVSKEASQKGIKSEQH